MNIGVTHQDMTAHQVASALRLAPDAHPIFWHERLAELRRQDRDVEADWIEHTFPEYMSSKAAEMQDRFTAKLLAWADKRDGS